MSYRSMRNFKVTWTSWVIFRRSLIVCAFSHQHACEIVEGAYKRTPRVHAMFITTPTDEAIHDALVESIRRAADRYGKKMCLRRKNY